MKTTSKLTEDFVKMPAEIPINVKFTFKLRHIFDMFDSSTGLIVYLGDMEIVSFKKIKDITTLEVLDYLDYNISATDKLKLEGNFLSVHIVKPDSINAISCEVLNEE